MENGEVYVIGSGIHVMLKYFAVNWVMRMVLKSLVLDMVMLTDPYGLQGSAVKETSQQFYNVDTLASIAQTVWRVFMLVFVGQDHMTQLLYVSAGSLVSG